MRRTLVMALFLAAAPLVFMGSATAQSTMRKMQPLHTDPAIVGADAAAAARAADAVAAADAGPPKFVETADQKRRRQEYSAKTGPIFSSLIHANNKQVTQDERDVIKKHWGRAHLLWRVRANAENESDRAAVIRVDQLFAKMDNKVFDKLRKLNDKAPVKVADAGAK